MKKVLITSRSFGKTSDEPFKILTAANIEYTLMGANYSDDSFAAALPGFDALIIGAHKLDDELMGKCPKLKIICKHGAGLDNINLNMAKAHGITVTNVPAMNSNAVADLAFAHILNIMRGVSAADGWVRNGQWKTFLGKDIYRKTLGLIGFGAIAKKVAMRASGFSMNVIAYDAYVNEVPSEFKNVTLCDFDRVVAESDIVSIHAPLTEETKGIFNKSTILKMKPDAVIINTGRGGIINEKDLFECMKGGHLFGAALDVTATEPIEQDNPLLTLDNVVITPHIGMYSIEAVNAVSIACAKNVAKKLDGEMPDFVVV